jgi:DNA-directed RNA polymerase specialized sigma24 family protein
MKATPENIMYFLNKHHELSDDDRQELAVQLWSKSEQYDDSRAKLTTWVGAAVKNYLISKKRKKKTMSDLTISLSIFDRENDEGRPINNLIGDSLASEQLSAEEAMIYLEEKEKALTELKSRLTNRELDVLQLVLDGTYDAKKANDRVIFHRIMKKITEKN